MKNILIIAAGFIALLGLRGGYLEWKLSQALAAENRAHERAYRAIQQRVQLDGEEIAVLREHLDAARAIRPKVKIVRDTVRLPVDPRPFTTVVIRDTNYLAHVPVADALEHYMREAAIVDTLTVPVDRIVARVDTLRLSANAVISDLSRKPSWLSRAGKFALKLGCVSLLAGIGEKVGDTNGAMIGAGAGTIACR